MSTSCMDSLSASSPRMHVTDHGELDARDSALLLWCRTDVAGQPSVKSYHDSAAQASFATKAVFLIDGIVPLLSHWAFSDIFEEQVRTRQASPII